MVPGSKPSPASMLRIVFFFGDAVSGSKPLLFLRNFHEVSVLSDRTDVGNRMLKPALPIYVK